MHGPMNVEFKSVGVLLTWKDVGRRMEEKKLI